MPDIITNVETLDIQLLDESRSNATTVKLDNPRENVTREQVSAAMQTAFANGWFLTSKGDVAMYLGDVTINKSIKTKLGGEDFYVTPNSLTMKAVNESQTEYQPTITVSGATIQGYNYTQLTGPLASRISKFTVTIAPNGLSATLYFLADSGFGAGDDYCTMDFYLVIQGVRITIPVRLEQANA